MKNQHAIKFGILAGIGTIIFLFLFYWIDRKLMLSPSVIWSTFFLYLLGMYMACVEERKDNGGYLAFKDALKAAFLVYVVANIIYYSYNYLLFNFIDPEMLGIQKEYMITSIEELEGLLNNSSSESVSYTHLTLPTKRIV